MRNIRSGIVALIPRGSRLAGFQSALGIIELLLVDFSKSLLLASSPSEIALGTVTLNRHLDASHGGLGVGLAVGLEGVDQAIRGVVRFVEVLGEDFGSLFEGLSGIEIYPCKRKNVRLGAGGRSAVLHVLTLLLHLEGVGRLDKQVGGILVLVFAAAEKAEAAAGSLQRLLGLYLGNGATVRSECPQPVSGVGEGLSSAHLLE